MTDAAISRPSAVPYAAAIYLAIVQFFFTIGWTVYVIFLPQLLEVLHQVVGEAVIVIDEDDHSDANLMGERKSGK